jgi:hypothetical protein
MPSKEAASMTVVPSLTSACIESIVILMALLNDYCISRASLAANITFNTFFLVDPVDFIGFESNGI